MVYRTAIHRRAHRHAEHDVDLADDLEQEAWIAAWRFDPSHVCTDARAVVLRVARDAMREWLCRERQARRDAFTWRFPAVRASMAFGTRVSVVSIRRFAPVHAGAAPLPDRYAA